MDDSEHEQRKEQIEAVLEAMKNFMTGYSVGFDIQAHVLADMDQWLSVHDDSPLAWL